MATDYAARIRAARAFAGITQQEMADLLGIDVQTIKRREAGTQQPKRGERLAIAAITGVPADFLEYGFGEISQNEVIDRLDRIEGMLGGADAPDAALEYAERVVSELRADADAAEAGAPTRVQQSDRRRAAP